MQWRLWIVLEKKYNGIIQVNYKSSQSLNKVQYWLPLPDTDDVFTCSSVSQACVRESGRPATQTAHPGIIPFFPFCQWRPTRSTSDFTLCFERQGAVAWLTCKGGVESYCDMFLGGASVASIENIIWSGTKMQEGCQFFFSVWCLKNNLQKAT